MYVYDIYIYIWQRLINPVTVNWMKTLATPPWVTQVDPKDPRVTPGLHRRLLPEGVPPLSLPFSCMHACNHTQSAMSYSRHVGCVPQQTCLLCHTEDMSAMLHSKHVGRVRQQTCLLCDTADMSAAVSHSRHYSFVTQQICLLSHVDFWAPVDRPRQVNLNHPRGNGGPCSAMNLWDADLYVYIYIWWQQFMWRRFSLG